MACRQGERRGTCGSRERISCALKKSQRKDFFSGVLRAAPLKNYPSRSLAATFLFWANHRRDRLRRHRRICSDTSFEGVTNEWFSNATPLIGSASCSGLSRNETGGPKENAQCDRRLQSLDVAQYRRVCRFR